MAVSCGSCKVFDVKFFDGTWGRILRRTNISHLGKRKIVFKVPWEKDMLVPWRVNEFCFLILMVALSLDTQSLKEKVPFNTPSFTFPINHARKASRKRLLQGPTITELNELGFFHLFITVDGWWFLHQIDFSYDFVYQPIRKDKIFGSHG